MGEQRGLAPLLTVDLAPVTVELNLRESGARFPCKWSSVLEIYTVSAKEATVAEIEEPATLAEKEKGTIPRQEAPQEEQPEPEIGPIETPVASELQPSTGQAPAKNSAPEPTPPQPPKELQPGDKVYVAGFGWVEYEGPNHCEDGTDIYENGNKIGSMG